MDPVDPLGNGPEPELYLLPSLPFAPTINAVHKNALGSQSAMSTCTPYLTVLEMFGQSLFSPDWYLSKEP